jgi:gas vesicle protein
VRLRSEQKGFIPIIAGIIAGAIVLAVVAVVLVAPLLTQEERAEICGTGVNEASRKWLEVVMDRIDPKVTRIDVLTKSYIDMIHDSLSLVDTLDVICQHERNDHTIGKTQIFGLGEWVFANVVFFGEWTLQ